MRITDTGLYCIRNIMWYIFSTKVSITGLEELSANSYSFNFSSSSDMSNTLPISNLYLSADFESDVKFNPRDPFNPSIMKSLMDKGYMSYDFLPPVDDSAWGDKMLKVITDPMVEYVKNRLRRRSERLTGELHNSASSPKDLFLLVSVLLSCCDDY